MTQSPKAAFNRILNRKMVHSWSDKYDYAMSHYNWVKKKYERFFGEVFETYDEFEKRYLTENMYIMAEWNENGILLIDVCFDPMANEIVVVENP